MTTGLNREEAHRNNFCRSLLSLSLPVTWIIAEFYTVSQTKVTMKTNLGENFALLVADAIVFAVVIEVLSALLDTCKAL